MKWYDYIVIFIFADIMTTLLFSLMFAPSLWISIISGFMLTFVWDGWNMYERFRYNANRN